MSAVHTHFPTTNTTRQKYVFKLFSTIPRALGGRVLQRRMKPLVVVFCQVFVGRRKSQSSLTGGQWLSVDSEYSIVFNTVDVTRHVIELARKSRDNTTAWRCAALHTVLSAGQAACAPRRQCVSR